MKKIKLNAILIIWIILLILFVSLGFFFNNNFKDIGVGFNYCGGINYYVQEFGTPL